MDKAIRTPKEHIEEIIGKTFEAVQDAYNYQTESGPKLGNPERRKLSRIIFPRKRKEPIRVSEQELRFVFVEQLNNEFKEEGVILGPTTPYISFEKDKFLRVALVKYRNQELARQILSKIIKSLINKSQVNISVNIDPYNL